MLVVVNCLCFFLYNNGEFQHALVVQLDSEYNTTAMVNNNYCCSTFIIGSTGYLFVGMLHAQTYIRPNMHVFYL